MRANRRRSQQNLVEILGTANQTLAYPSKGRRMTRKLLFLFLLATGASSLFAFQLTMDGSEAEAVLSILDKKSAGTAVVDADWQRVFTSQPYVRLKTREASMHREFTDDDFRRFVLSSELLARREALARTLARWKHADLNAAADRVKSYLPAGAHVRAKVYPMIKPKPNSFVFEAATDPAIFLYLDPEQSSSDFENTVAHESHHIGLTDAQAKYDKIVEATPEPKRAVLNWVAAFGEGLAVLAAAGSLDRHPMEGFSSGDRVRWDQDMKYVDQELAQVDQFFRDVLRGGFKDREAVDHVAFTFFGYRGPWYVVGYRMAAVVEQQLGREELLKCMTDPRRLLIDYNVAATRLNQTATEKLPLWSDAVIDAMK